MGCGWVDENPSSNPDPKAMLDFIALVMLIGFLAGGMILFIILVSRDSARNGGPRIRMGGRGRRPGLRISSSRFRSRSHSGDAGTYHVWGDYNSGDPGSGGGDCGGGGGDGD